jgi:hypothetical protein
VRSWMFKNRKERTVDVSGRWCETCSQCPAGGAQRTVLGHLRLCIGVALTSSGYRLSDSSACRKCDNQLSLSGIGLKLKHPTFHKRKHLEQLESLHRPMVSFGLYACWSQAHSCTLRISRIQLVPSNSQLCAVSGLI